MRSPATIPGPIGPPSPSTVSKPPPASASAATHAQKRPGRRPIELNHPATPAIDPPAPTKPSLSRPCGMTTPPMTTLRSSNARSRYMDFRNGSPHTREGRDDRAQRLACHLGVRLAVRSVSVIALLAGVVFFFQGIGVIPGSFMTGRSEWAVIVAALVAGAGALYWLSGMVGPGGGR